MAYYHFIETKHESKNGSDCIRLVFVHSFPLNSRASGNFVADGKVPVYTLMMDPVQLMGSPLFKTLALL